MFWHLCQWRKPSRATLRIQHCRRLSEGQKDTCTVEPSLMYLAMSSWVAKIASVQPVCFRKADWLRCGKPASIIVAHYHSILAINCVHASNWFTHLQPTWQIDGQNDNSVLTVMEFPKFLPDKNFRGRKQKAAWHCIYMYSDSITMPSAEFTRNTWVSSVHP